MSYFYEKAKLFTKVVYTVHQVKAGDSVPSHYFLPFVKLCH